MSRLQRNNVIQSVICVINIFLRVKKWDPLIINYSLFFLKLNDEYSSLVWTMKKSLANEIVSMTDEKFIEEINKSFVII